MPNPLSLQKFHWAHNLPDVITTVQMKSESLDYVCGNRKVSEVQYIKFLKLCVYLLNVYNLKIYSPK